MPPANERTHARKFIIEPHLRLQEWIADERGHVTSEGLDYEFLCPLKIAAGSTKRRFGIGLYQIP